MGWLKKKKGRLIGGVKKTPFRKKKGKLKKKMGARWAQKKIEIRSSQKNVKNVDKL